LLDPGDVAIVPEPGYAVYEGGTVLAGAEPYRYALTPRTGFLLELDEIPTDVLHRAKLVYLNYPNNPTATIAPRGTLAARSWRWDYWGSSGTRAWRGGAHRSGFRPAPAGNPFAASARSDTARHPRAQSRPRTRRSPARGRSPHRPDRAAPSRDGRSLPSIPGAGAAR